MANLRPLHPFSFWMLLLFVWYCSWWLAKLPTFAIFDNAKVWNDLYTWAVRARLIYSSRYLAHFWLQSFGGFHPPIYCPHNKTLWHIIKIFKLLVHNSVSLKAQGLLNARIWNMLQNSSRNLLGNNYGRRREGPWIFLYLLFLDACLWH